ncbi:MAG: acyl-CoA dehydrogenase [Bacillota bacterium]
MRFELTEEQLAIQKAIRELVEKEIAPGARERDESGEFPAHIFRRLGEQGYMGMMLPEEYGGIGADHLSHTICVEEISKGCASTGVIFEVHNSLVSETILHRGNAYQKDLYLPRMTGEWLGAFALTEPGAGSDAGSVAATAVRDGDYYVLNGTKCFISNAGQAQLYLIIASTDRSKGSRGLSAFLVESSYPGLSTGKPEAKMGIRASSTADVILEDCRVPASNLLGQEGEGLKIALGALDSGRIGIAAQALGIAQAAMEKAGRYAKQRIQFGKPIAEFQAIQWMLADMATDIDAARLLTYRAAYLRSKGVRCSAEVAKAKLFASTMAMRHTVKAVQIMGGYGYMREYDVERHLRDAKITEIYEGTSEVMRMVIAGQLLKDLD